MKKALSLLLAVTTILMLLSGCGSSATTSTSSADTGSGEKVLKIGEFLPTTGEQAEVGLGMMHACEMAFEEAGYKVGDYTLDVKVYDHTIDPEKGCLAMEQAITKDGIDVAFMNWSSSVALATMDVVANYQMPYYFPFGATYEIDKKYATDPEYYSYYIGKGWSAAKYLNYAYAEVITEAIDNGTWALRNRKLVILADDTDYSRSCVEAQKEAFTAAGWEVVYEDYFAATTTDFYSTLSKIKELDASLIASSIDIPAASAAFLKQFREVNVNALVILDDLACVANFYDLTGDAADFVLDQSPKFTTEEGLAFSAEFEERYGVAPSAGSAGLAYDFTKFFLLCLEDALDKYGELTTDTLYEYAQEYVMQGKITYTDGVVMPELKFDVNTEYYPSPIIDSEHYVFPVVQYVEVGDSVAVWPDSLKEGNLVIPDYAK